MKTVGDILDLLQSGEYNSSDLLNMYRNFRTPVQNLDETINSIPSTKTNNDAYSATLPDSDDRSAVYDDAQPLGLQQYDNSAVTNNIYNNETINTSLNNNSENSSNSSIVEGGGNSNDDVSIPSYQQNINTDKQNISINNNDTTTSSNVDMSSDSLSMIGDALTSNESTTNNTSTSNDNNLELNIKNYKNSAPINRTNSISNVAAENNFKKNYLSDIRSSLQNTNVLNTTGDYNKNTSNTSENISSVNNVSVNEQNTTNETSIPPQNTNNISNNSIDNQINNEGDSKKINEFITKAKNYTMFNNDSTNQGSMTKDYNAYYYRDIKQQEGDTFTVNAMAGENSDKQYYANEKDSALTTATMKSGDNVANTVKNQMNQLTTAFNSISQGGAAGAGGLGSNMGSQGDITQIGDVGKNKFYPQKNDQRQGMTDTYGGIRDPAYALRIRAWERIRGEIAYVTTT